MNDREIFQRNLSKFLAESGMLQKDIAASLGVNRSTVSAWMTGRGYPRVDIMEKLAILFGVTTANIVGDPSAEETEEDRLLSMFKSLNSTGKAKLIERAEELLVLYGEKSSDVSGKVHRA